MMDFLHRLAPPRVTDASRAVAVLPSRFAGDSPLRAAIGQVLPAQRPDDDETSLSLDGPPRRDNEKATSSTDAPTGAGAPDIDVADPRAFRNRRGANSERARPASPELQGLAAALPASHGLQGVAPSPAQPRVALPLSQAILAQRTLQSRDDGQVVHVTIGRIDVVANAAPAPAVRRSPTPRQGTVTLADYLRGGNGSRR